MLASTRLAFYCHAATSTTTMMHIGAQEVLDRVAEVGLGKVTDEQYLTGEGDLILC